MLVTTTHSKGVVVGMRSMPGNPYDGHTLREGGIAVGWYHDGHPSESGLSWIAVIVVALYRPRRSTSPGKRARLPQRSDATYGAEVPLSQ